MVTRSLLALANALLLHTTKILRQAYADPVVFANVRKLRVPTTQSARNCCMARLLAGELLIPRYSQCQAGAVGPNCNILIPRHGSNTVASAKFSYPDWYQYLAWLSQKYFDVACIANNHNNHDSAT